jgi:hypothetical protein
MRITPDLTMNIHKALRELYEEKKRLDASIAILERRLQDRPRLSGSKRRGRRHMSAAERLQVSKRMSQYWAARRAQSNALESAANSEPVATAAQASA